MTAVDVAGDVQWSPALRTQHVAAQALARLASSLQPGSKLSASIAAQQATLWHTISSFSSFGTTSSALLPILHTLSPSQLLTSTAAQAQSTGSTAISAGRLCSQIRTTLQAALSQASPNRRHQQHLTGMASFLPKFLAQAKHGLSSLTQMTALTAPD